MALADDNFYPVTLTDLNLAAQQKNTARLNELKAIRAERFELMSRLAQLPEDMVFFTQITMEAAEDTDFLDAMKAARIKGALVGVESVTPAGLKDVYKDFNLAGESLIERLKTFRRHGVHVLGSFIFGIPRRSFRPAGRFVLRDNLNRSEAPHHCRDFPKKLHGMRSLACRAHRPGVD